jgi:hypothetical protein
MIQELIPELEELEELEKILRKKVERKEEWHQLKVGMVKLIYKKDS